MSYNRFTVPIRKGNKKPKKDLTVAILAGDPGYRMRSLGPKCLLKNGGGITILDMALSAINTIYPTSNIIVTTGFESECVRGHLDKDITLIENQIYDYTNSLEELRLVVNAINNSHLLIIGGDMIFNNQAIDNVRSRGTSLVYENLKLMPENDVGVQLLNGTQLEKMTYNSGIKWTRVAYFTYDDVCILKGILNQRRFKTFLLHESINLLKQQTKVSCISPNGISVKRINSKNDAGWLSESCK